MNENTNNWNHIPGRGAHGHPPFYLSDEELDEVVSQAKRLAETDVIGARAILMPDMEPILGWHARVLCARICHGANNGQLCSGPGCPHAFSIAEHLLEVSVYGHGPKMGAAVMLWPETTPFRVYLDGVVAKRSIDTLRGLNGARGIPQAVHAGSEGDRSKGDQAVVAIIAELADSALQATTLRSASKVLDITDVAELAVSLLRAMHSDASHTCLGPVRDDRRIARLIVRHEPSQAQLQAIRVLVDAVESIARRHPHWYEGHILAPRNAKQAESADAPNQASEIALGARASRSSEATESARWMKPVPEMEDQARLEALVAALVDGSDLDQLSWLTPREAAKVRVEYEARRSIQKAALQPINDRRVIDRGAMLLRNGNALHEAASQALIDSGYTTKAMVSRELVNAIKAKAYRPDATTSLTPGSFREP